MSFPTATYNPEITPGIMHFNSAAPEDAAAVVNAAEQITAQAEQRIIDTEFSAIVETAFNPAERQGLVNDSQAVEAQARHDALEAMAAPAAGEQTVQPEILDPVGIMRVYSHNIAVLRNNIDGEGSN